MDFMDFSFSNSTYTALLALFAAIFGVGYPLIIQAIGEIDKKYDSTLLLKCFEEEPDFKRFNKRVLTCIFFSITTPFILFLSNAIYSDIHLGYCLHCDAFTFNVFDRIV